MCVVRGSASRPCLLAHRSPGLKEEDSSPTRNGYKVRSFQAAIAAIHEHDKPIRSGKEAIKVRTAWSPLNRTTYCTIQLRGIGLGIANRIDFFLQGKEYVCTRVRGDVSYSLLVFNRTRHRTSKQRRACWRSKHSKKYRESGEPATCDLGLMLPASLFFAGNERQQIS